MPSSRSFAGGSQPEYAAGGGGRGGPTPRYGDAASRRPKLPARLPNAQSTADPATTSIDAEPAHVPRSDHGPRPSKWSLARDKTVVPYAWHATSLLWILLIFAIRTFRNSGGGTPALIVALVIGVAVVVMVAFLVPDRTSPHEQVIELASDYPVPPLDLAVPIRPRHQLRRRRENAAPGAVPIAIPPWTVPAMPGERRCRRRGRMLSCAGLPRVDLVPSRCDRGVGSSRGRARWCG